MNFSFKSLNSNQIKSGSQNKKNTEQNSWMKFVLSFGRISSSDMMPSRFHTVYLHQCFTGHADGLPGESSGFRRLRRSLGRAGALTAPCRLSCGSVGVYFGLLVLTQLQSELFRQLFLFHPRTQIQITRVLQPLSSSLGLVNLFS